MPCAAERAPLNALPIAVTIEAESLWLTIVVTRATVTRAEATPNRRSRDIAEPF